MGKLTAQLGRLNGLKAMRFTVELLRRTTAQLREAPDAIRAAKIDEGLLVDQVVPAGNTLAEALRIPLVTVCNALAMMLIRPYRRRLCPGDVNAGFSRTRGLSRSSRHFSTTRGSPCQSVFTYTGPWHDPIGGGEPTDFPWEKLDGRR